MSKTNQVATSQPTSYQQQREHLRQHLTINDTPPDEATITRILKAKPAPTNTRSTLPTREFRLLR